MLKLRGRAAVIVGGGSVARRRAGALAAAGAAVTVIAPSVIDGIETPGVNVIKRGYEAGDLDGAMLVVIATDDAAVNDRVQRDAEAAGVLINRADDPEAGNFVVPAHRQVGPVTVAVSTDGISAKAAAAIRDAMLDTMDPDWITLLQTVAPYRAAIQTNITEADRRTAALKQLTDEQAMATLKQHGTAALIERCEQLVSPS